SGWVALPAGEPFGVAVPAAVAVAVALALTVGVADTVGVGVSVGITPASAFGASDASPITIKAPAIRTTSPATNIRPIHFSFSLCQLSTAATVQNERNP